MQEGIPRSHAHTYVIAHYVCIIIISHLVELIIHPPGTYTFLIISLPLAINYVYRIAGNFRGVLFSLFSRIYIDPRTINPRSESGGVVSNFAHIAS